MKIPSLDIDWALAEEILLAPPADEAIEMWMAAFGTADEAADEAALDLAQEPALATAG